MRHCGFLLDRRVTKPIQVGFYQLDDGIVGEVTTGAKAYIAKGTSSSADWMLLN